MHKLLVKKVIFQRLVGVFLLLSVFCTAAPGAVAQQTDSLDRLFTIRELKVDETARRASEARQAALAKVQVEAYHKLLLKITQPEGREKLSALTTPEIQSLISGIEVVDEKSSSTRYIATLNVRFEPSLFSQFLAQHDVPHVLSTGRGVLVLHAHKDPLSEHLWMPSPAMEKARGSVDWLNRIRQYVFARGELRDRAAVTFSEVKNLEAGDAGQIARTLDVKSVLLISTEWGIGDDGAKLGYTFRSLDGQAKGEGQIIPQPGYGEADALRAAYEAILDQIDSEWRSQLLVDTGVGGELEALVPTTSQAILVDIEKRLSEVTLVGGFRIMELGVPLSRIHFSYTGREDQLYMALRYAGLDVVEYGAEKMIKVREDILGGVQ